MPGGLGVQPHSVVRACSQNRLARGRFDLAMVWAPIFAGLLLWMVRLSEMAIASRRECARRESLGELFMAAQVCRVGRVELGVSCWGHVAGAHVARALASGGALSVA